MQGHRQRNCIPLAGNKSMGIYIVGPFFLIRLILDNFRCTLFMHVLHRGGSQKLKQCIVYNKKKIDEDLSFPLFPYSFLVV